MQIKELLEKKETSEQKITETQKAKEFSNLEYKDVLKEQLDIVKSNHLESLREQNNRLINDAEEKKLGLTEDEKAKIREAHPDWSDEIIDAISLWKEYEIYDRAGLVYAEINGKPCLIHLDIDMNQKNK